jgi:hypothetical protein
MDNNHGQDEMSGDFWITSGCPVHDPEETIRKEILEATIDIHLIV